MNKINKIQNNKFNSSKSNIRAIESFSNDIESETKDLALFNRNSPN